MIKIEKLNKTYDRRRKNANHVLKDITLDLPDTGFVCILGPSGCGKTSLLNAIGGLDRFESGTISLGSVSVSRYGKRRYEAERNRNFGYIFQNYYLLPEHSVAYNIYLGLHSLKLSHKEKLQRIRDALEAVDMSRYIRRKVGELSGGQQQRIAIARALARKPRVIFADEPTGNLDEANTMNICTLLRKISRQSLVIMVTHEERIANFFADRIISLDGGRICSDDREWQRGSLSVSAEKEIFAGDYQQAQFTAQQVSLRVLQEADAAPLELTVIALKDRIILKLADGRAITCGEPGQVPVLREGKRPALTLETVDQSQNVHTAVTDANAAEQTRAGRGIRFGMLLREARFLAAGGGARRIGMRLFLLLLTLLTIWTAADYLTVSAVDPQDFVTTHSQVLEIKMKRGSSTSFLLDDLYHQFTYDLSVSGLEFDFIPSQGGSLGFRMVAIAQMENIMEYFYNFSYVPLSHLDESTLIYGKMPQQAGQVVVDRWVLEQLLEEDSIVSNAASDISFFLNRDLFFDRGTAAFTIVGICESQESAVYLGQADLIRANKQSYSIMSLSEFKAAHPGEYDELELSPEECLVNTAFASPALDAEVGQYVYYQNGFSWTLKQKVQTQDPAAIIVHDDHADRFVRYLCTPRFYIYCADKAEAKAVLEQQIAALDGALVVDVVDAYSEAQDAYLEASRLKVSTRTIVTVTVMLISMVMLYLLCRSQAQERISMLAVYRLLGIPRRKLGMIFALEAALCSLRTALPAAALSWLVIRVLDNLENLGFSLLLPWTTALAVYIGVLLYHILAALLPLLRLLYMPPAQLAAKYDY